MKTLWSRTRKGAWLIVVSIVLVGCAPRRELTMIGPAASMVEAEFEGTAGVRLRKGLYAEPEACARSIGLAIADVGIQPVWILADTTRHRTGTRSNFDTLLLGSVVCGTALDLSAWETEPVDHPRRTVVFAVPEGEVHRLFAVTVESRTDDGSPVYELPKTMRWAVETIRRIPRPSVP